VACLGVGLTLGHVQPPVWEDAAPDAIEQPVPPVGEDDVLYHYDVKFENTKGERITKEERNKASLLRAAMQRRPW